MRKGVLLPCLCALMALSGCVTTKTYESALSDSAACREKVRGIEAARAACVKEKEAQGVRIASFEKAFGDCERQGAVCAKDREGQAAQIGFLRGELDGIVKQSEYQAREIDPAHL